MRNLKLLFPILFFTICFFSCQKEAIESDFESSSQKDVSVYSMESVSASEIVALLENNEEKFKTQELEVFSSNQYLFDLDNSIKTSDSLNHVTYSIPFLKKR